MNRTPTPPSRIASVLVAVSMLVATLGIFAVSPAHAASPNWIYMVGDSLTQGSLPYQSAEFDRVGWPNRQVSGYHSRSVRNAVLADPYPSGLAAVDGLRAAHGNSKNWVVALGTNDSGLFGASQYPTLIREMLDQIGPGRRVMWVNIYMPKTPHRQTNWNNALNQVALERPDQLVVFDFASLAAQNPGWMSGDKIHLTSTGYAGRSAAIADASVQLMSGAEQVPEIVPTINVAGGTAGLVPVGPTRAFDSRSGAPFNPGETRSLTLTDVVPADTTVVAVNITAADPAADGFITAYPCDRPLPDASNLNFLAGRNASSLALVRLDSDHLLCLFSVAATDVIVDVTAAFVPGHGSRLTPVGPTRLADTRSNGAPLDAGATLEVDVGLVTAAMVNITVADPAGNGYVTAYPCDTPRPETSSLNYDVGRSARANAAIIPAGPNASVCIYTHAPTHIVVDIIGTFTPGGDLLFQPVDVTRLLDTRTGRGGWLGKMLSGQTITVQAPGAADKVVVGTLTAVHPSGSGYLTAWSGDGTVDVSNLNYEAAEVIANAATSMVADDSRFRLLSVGSGGHVVFDVAGWFTP
jgi:lysophospholipase L1-like esterase